MPPAWKEAIGLAVEFYRTEIDSVIDLDELLDDPRHYLDLFLNDAEYRDYRDLLFEAVAEVAPWVVSEVITRDNSSWLENELYLMARDIKGRGR